MPQQEGYFIYILRCADNTLYIGITTNINRRLKQHNGELTGGARYTQHRRPVTVIFVEKSHQRSEATKRELALKKLTRKQKEEFINNSTQEENMVCKTA